MHTNPRRFDPGAVLHNSCLTRERERVRNDCEDGVRARQNRGEAIARDLDDWSRDDRCSSGDVSMCQSGCESDQHTCYTTCGGKGTSATVCTAFCDEK